MKCGCIAASNLLGLAAPCKGGKSSYDKYNVDRISKDVLPYSVTEWPDSIAVDVSAVVLSKEEADSVTRLQGQLNLIRVW